MKKISYKSPIGNLVVAENNNAIISLEWSDEMFFDNTDLLLETVKQLEEYFDGKRKEIDVEIEADGTDFQCKVWEEILKIPYGETITYQDIAINLKSHPRAVGIACGKNPLPIIIPCHRVVGKNNKLTGYSGGKGLKTKEFLLILEGLRNV